MNLCWQALHALICQAALGVDVKDWTTVSGIYQKGHGGVGVLGEGDV